MATIIATPLDLSTRGHRTTVGPVNVTRTWTDGTDASAIALRARQSADRTAAAVKATVDAKAARKAARKAKRATSYSDTELVALALSMTTTD